VCANLALVAGVLLVSTHPSTYALLSIVWYQTCCSNIISDKVFYSQFAKVNAHTNLSPYALLSQVCANLALVAGVLLVSRKLRAKGQP
jgi:hypothetical protein